MDQVKRTFAVALVLALSAFGLASPATADDPPTTGIIVVSVTNRWNGAPSTGGCVTALGAGDVAVATDCVGVSGVYTLPDLVPGDYKIQALGFDGAAPEQSSSAAPDVVPSASLTVLPGESQTFAMILYGEVFPQALVNGALTDTVRSGDAAMWRAHGVNPGHAAVSSGDTSSLYGKVMVNRYPAPNTPAQSGWVEVWGGSTMMGWSPIASDGSYQVTGIPFTQRILYVRVEGSIEAASQWMTGNNQASGSTQVWMTEAPHARELEVLLNRGNDLQGTLVQPFYFETETVCATLWLKSDNWVHSPRLDTLRYDRTRCGEAGSNATLGPVLAGAHPILVHDSRGNYFWYRHWNSSMEFAWVGVTDGTQATFDFDLPELSRPEGSVAGVATQLTVTAPPWYPLDAFLFQRVPGGEWVQVGNPFTVTNGIGTVGVTPSRGIEYGVIVLDVAGFPMPTNGVHFRTAGTPDVTRIGGESRYDVAVGISEDYFAGGASVVYVATGTNFPDALSAAPAASLQGAPLLLVDTNVIPQSVRDELVRLGPDKIIIAGGPASVSDAVMAQLQTYATTVVRHSGENRYEVSNKITRDAFTSATVAYIATGATFPDALSASAAAGHVNAPVILVYGLATTLDADTADLLQDLGVTDIRIAGGPASVHPNIETALRNLPGVTSVTRLTGADRFVVSGATNRAAFTAADTVFLASGLNFPDALSGAAVAGAVGAPLYVIPPSCVPGYVIDDIANFGATEVRIFGGPASVTPAAAALTRC
jgi:putative cell wall-binding protein